MSISVAELLFQISEMPKKQKPPLTTCCCLPACLPSRPPQGPLPGEGQSTVSPCSPTLHGSSSSGWSLDLVQPQRQDKNSTLLRAFEPIKKTNDRWLIFPSSPPTLSTPWPPPPQGMGLGTSGLCFPSVTTRLPHPSLLPPKPALGLSRS